MPKSAKKRTDPRAIGLRVRQLRGTERQDDLAPFLGITQGHLSKIERGMQAPTAEVLLRLSERYAKKVDWILKGEERG
jgi:transcriptional regulator with XRE-family HTH domain